MTSQILQALVLAVRLTGFITDKHQNEMCLKNQGQMKCETTIQFIDVNHGENLILNCTCFNNRNGQWVGPNRSPTLYTTADRFIPYTQGTILNPDLNRSKFAVLGGYDKKECQLQIMNFVSDDEGLYKCQYTDSPTVYIHTYNVVAIRFPAYNICPKSLTDPMPCKKTLHVLHVKAGDSLILNCTCFNKNNGHWTGPNKTSSSETDHFITYTHGTELDPRLNKSKYIVFGGYQDTLCYFMIKNFTSDDDGEYTCRYISSLSIYINAYKIVAKYPEFVSTSSFAYCWIIMGSLLGILVICFIMSHVFYCLNRATKSSLVISQEVQYDEIGTIHYNEVMLEPLSDGNHENTSRVSDSNNSFFRGNTESSDESSVLRQSSLAQYNDDYENPYQTINLENIEIHKYSSILSNNYQNTTIFPVSSVTKTQKSCKTKDGNHWLVIYMKEKNKITKII